MREVRIPAFAKINLRLDVVGKRPDGYHELRTIFQSVSLHDELRLHATRRPGVSLSIKGNEKLSSEPVEKNLVYRAVEMLRADLKIRAGVEIELRKNIPAGRGLGGGSSDAAAALLGYLRFTGHKVPVATLMEMAAALGADVPFFLFGGRALGVSRGDEIYPLPDIKKVAVLIVSPPDIHVATPEAFGWLDEQALRASQGSAAGRPALTKAGLESKLWKFCALCWSAQGSGLSNDFEEPVFRRHARLQEIKRVLLRRGAAEASLAGSGSAVFGVFPSPVMARRAAVGFPNDQTFVCETLSREKYVRALRGARVGG
ncbi:MAG: 4-(cytidine 5'-diphospho)-2-C-methyl-D-erythritol kinase [Candidatus Acidiferrum sp.]